MNVTLGAMFQIVCEPKGVPYPIISWFHNGVHVTNTYDGERRLTVEVKHYDMAGRIDCVANNGVGSEPKSAGILLIVNCQSMHWFAVGHFFTSILTHSSLAWNQSRQCCGSHPSRTASEARVLGVLASSCSGSLVLQRIANQTKQSDHDTGNRFGEQ